jgi:hypothetical protein
MKSRKEIINRIIELTPEFEKAEEAYFSIVEEKQSGEDIYAADFLKIESEYEILKKEIETLQWVVYSEENQEENQEENEDSFNHTEG